MKVLFGNLVSASERSGQSGLFRPETPVEMVRGFKEGVRPDVESGRSSRCGVFERPPGKFLAQTASSVFRIQKDPFELRETGGLLLQRHRADHPVHVEKELEGVFGGTVIGLDVEKICVEGVEFDDLSVFQIAPCDEADQGVAMDRRKGGQSVGGEIDGHQRKHEIVDSEGTQPTISCVTVQEESTQGTPGRWRQVHALVPMPHQEEALAAWLAVSCRGVCALPTGSGKTHVGVMAIESTGSRTLVVVPTIELLSQWRQTLRFAFGVDVGQVGGGEVDWQPLTVITYASFVQRSSELPGRFELVIFDECHHLSGEQAAAVAGGLDVRFRLGLSATPDIETSLGAGDALISLDELIGPIVLRGEVGDFSGPVLSEYRVVTLEVDLTEEERASYQEHRKRYLAFLGRHRIRVQTPRGWSRFVRIASRSKAGRQAFWSHRVQRQVAQRASGKLDCLERLLQTHVGERILVFTADNQTVHTVSRRFLVPALTHRTRAAERRGLLASFASGELPVLVTSRVLNEGVDVPDAGIAVVLSGSGSVREHVQRLGRILRRTEGKEAILYEVLAHDTAEESVSARRRDHEAYQVEVESC